MTLFNLSPSLTRCANSRGSSLAEETNPGVPFVPAKGALLLFLLAAVSSFSAELLSPHLFESGLLLRTGFDSNPTGMGRAASAPNPEEAFVYAVGINASLTLPTSVPAGRALKLAYFGEVVRFDRAPAENFATHRLGWNGQFTAGDWKFSGEGSTLLVAGSRDTLVSSSSVNANSISVWRERRRQWQHRLKLQAQADRNEYVVRATGTLLDYDYLTQAVNGKVPFADRSDVQGVVDLGWKQSPNSLWLTGVRVGRQHQAIIPLPNCAFDYTNDYERLVAGWEGKPAANTTLTIAAGPDFRYYSGAVDPRVFWGGRNRTSLWFEGGFAIKPRANLTVSGKAGRMNWLSSTGKSAYIDTNAESALAWTVTSAWTVRFSAKVHRCDYFPTIRDDWESMLGAGATLKISPRSLLMLDYLHHAGWNGLSTVSGREFRRELVNLSATVTL